MKTPSLRAPSRRKQLGFTVLEMITSGFCLAMLIGTGMSLMTSGSIFFRNTTTNAFAESDATYASRFVELKLEEASQFTISAASGMGAGTRIDFNDANGSACSFALASADDSGFAEHRSLLYTDSGVTNKVVLRGIPTATTVFSPTTTGIAVSRQSQMEAYRRITVTLPAERQSASGSGAVRLISQKSVVRVMPRNLYDDLNGNE